MSESTLTPEQQNEHAAKEILAEALNKLRNHTGSAIRDFEAALEILQNVERALESVPDELDAESIDLDVVAKAVRDAEGEWPDPLYVRSIQDDVNRASSSMSEAVGQLQYLLAGDFSE